VNLFAFILTVLLYIKGRLNKAKSSGSFLHDFVMGLELNPRFAGLDIKLFSLRPAMMGWLLLNLSFLVKHLQVNHGQVSTAMILYQSFSNFYVLDYFWHEVYMTSTWDIVAEHYGLMLVWGDYVWIPFAFSVQNWFLVWSKEELSASLAVLSVLFFVSGFVIFRVTNRQKHDFKHKQYKEKWGYEPKTVGGKLLVSGFWKYARHMNYLGDILLAICFSLPCGFSSIYPYLYPIYLTILLIQRETRDERRCSEKYGGLWKEYCRQVPYRIVPFIY